MDSHLSRRSLLVGTAGMAGMAVLAACGGGKKNAVKVDKPQSTSKQLNVLLTTGDPVVGLDWRIGMVMAGSDGFIKPDAPVTVAFGPDRGKGKDPGPFTAAQAAEVHLDAGGAPAYVTTTHKFDTTGVVWVQLGFKGNTARAAMKVVDPSASPVPRAGAKMISVATPTPADHQGVEPICTHDPPCPWHDPSLDVALKAGKPLAVLFATPRLCQTATCGPVLDTLLGLRSKYEPKVQFLHVEIYTDGSGKAAQLTEAPAVDAYYLPSEPVLFLAGGDGVIRQRIDGLFGAAEADQGLSRLLA